MAQMGAKMTATCWKGHPVLLLVTEEEEEEKEWTVRRDCHPYRLAMSDSEENGQVKIFVFFAPCGPILTALTARSDSKITALSNLHKRRR